MSLQKKLGIIVLIYVPVGFIWSVMVRLGYLLPAGGLEDPSYILHAVFLPIRTVHLAIVAGYTTYIQD